MMTRQQLIEFLQEYDVVDEVRVVDDFGHEIEIDELTWAGGAWICLKGMTLVDNDEIEEFLAWKGRKTTEHLPECNPRCQGDLHYLEANDA